MADYQFNTNLTPKIEGTNLGDMINMARGVQQYLLLSVNLRPAKLTDHFEQLIEPLHPDRHELCFPAGAFCGGLYLVCLAFDQPEKDRYGGDGDGRAHILNGEIIG